MWKSVGIIIPNLWENKTCSKPPTSWFWILYKVLQWEPNLNRTTILNQHVLCPPTFFPPAICMKQPIVPTLFNAHYFPVACQRGSQFSQPQKYKVKSICLPIWKVPALFSHLCLVSALLDTPCCNQAAVVTDPNGDWLSACAPRRDHVGTSRSLP